MCADIDVVDFENYEPSTDEERELYNAMTVDIPFDDSYIATDMLDRDESDCYMEYDNYAQVSGVMNNNMTSNAAVTNNSNVNQNSIAAFDTNSAYNTSVPQDDRIYLKVPFAEKDAAKSLGARWDGSCKKWYISSQHDKSKFSQWLM